jgi:hypothetical protein
MHRRHVKDLHNYLARRFHAWYTKFKPSSSAVVSAGDPKLGVVVQVEGVDGAAPPAKKSQYVVAQWSRHRAGRRLIAGLNPAPARYRRRPCGVAWMPFRTLMVEYINKWNFYSLTLNDISAAPGAASAPGGRRTGCAARSCSPCGGG